MKESFHRSGLVLLALLAGCETLLVESSASPEQPVAAACRTDSDCSDAEAADVLADAQRWSSIGKRRRSDTRAWLNCAAIAYHALGARRPEIGAEAAELATYCTSEFLGQAIGNPARRWSEGETSVGHVRLVVEFRQLSPYLHGPIALVRAGDVPMGVFDGDRFSTAGFGVPLAVVTPRCADRPLCQLLPREGVFRSATAWIEPGGPQPGAMARLIVADALKVGSMSIGDARYPLAVDTSAFYALGAGMSALRRLGILGLIGGNEVGRRAGVYILEEYDPAKRPVVMIHGLGSNPIAWARLSNAIWGDADLRTRYQVWHVVYQTDAPLLVTRYRIRNYLDLAWRVLDPEGDDPARSGMVVVGHSMGGVVARLLCVDSGDALWLAAFTSLPEQMRPDPERIALLESIFRFRAYPGISRAIFLAAPHRGSPSAESWFGRLSRVLVGRGVPELETLREFALDHPEAVRPELLKSYQKANFNSISTLQISQPVRRAGQALMPGVGIPYHTIAGVLTDRVPETDGVVPFSSAYLPEAVSTLRVASGHKIYANQEAVAEVLRILRADTGAGIRP